MYFQKEVKSFSGFRIGVQIQNRGVAPFYYPWPITVSVFDKMGEAVREVNPDWDIRQVEAGGSKQFSVTINGPSLPGGEYSIRMRIPNVMEGGYPIVFANKEASSDGWIRLGGFTVTG